MMADSFSSPSALPPMFLAATTPPSSSGDTFEDDACSICLDPFTTQDPPTVTGCKHEYHLQCILEWSQRRKECPICWQLLVLEDPSSQELLLAVETERKLSSRNISRAGPVNLNNANEFEPEQDSCSDDSDFDERIMLHLAAAASRAPYIRRREIRRSSRPCPSHILIFPPTADRPNQQAFALPEGGLNISFGSLGANLPAPGIPTVDSLQPRSSGVPPVVNAESSDGSFKSRVFFRRTQADSPGRTGSTELSSFPDSIKSKWSSASARCKESIAKGARGMKEKLLSRNDSVKELSRGVQQEMSAGIASVARMIERLDLTPKRTVATPKPGVNGGVSFSLKGKGLLEDIIAESVDKRSAENAHDASPDVSSRVLDTVPAEVAPIQVCKAVQRC